MISAPQRDLLTHLEQGLPLKHAARLTGLSLGSIFVWLEAGKLEAEARAAEQPAQRGLEYHCKLWKAFDLGKHIQELVEAEEKSARDDN